MKKEWFSTSELTGVGGLPGTTQGINQKARRERWQSRKRSGVQGKAVEYHIDSLPEQARTVLGVWEEGVSYRSTKGDPFVIWMTVYHQLTVVERHKLTALIIRRGVGGLMELVDKYQNEDD